MDTRVDRSPLETPVGRRLLQCASARELSWNERKCLYDMVAPVGLDPGAVAKFWNYVVMGPDRLLGFAQAAKCLAHKMGRGKPAQFLAACHDLVRECADRAEPSAGGFVFSGTACASIRSTHAMS